MRLNILVYISLKIRILQFITWNSDNFVQNGNNIHQYLDLFQKSREEALNTTQYIAKRSAH
jgi:hypothetical protein